MRRDPEHFGDRELVLVYVARKLKHALQVEDLLSAGGVDFAVEADKYAAGFIFRSQRVGAFFYVAPEDETKAQHTLRAAGLAPFVPPDAKS
jgi:hypothetical protein